MRFENSFELKEVVIEADSPFGIRNLSFSARYPLQPIGEPLRDIPLILEGPAKPLQRLVDFLYLLSGEDVPMEGEDYSWSSPIGFSEELFVLAFKDNSLKTGKSPEAASLSYMMNLTRPLVYTFLRDCIRVAGLKVSEQVPLYISSAGHTLIEMELRRPEIFPTNGQVVLTSW